MGFGKKKSLTHFWQIFLKTIIIGFQLISHQDRIQDNICRIPNINLDKLVLELLIDF